MENDILHGQIGHYARLEAAIRLTKHKILLTAYDFSHQGLAETLENKLREGVRLTILADRQVAHTQPAADIYNALIRAGALVYFPLDLSVGVTSTTWVFDSRTIMVGSANLTAQKLGLTSHRPSINVESVTVMMPKWDAVADLETRLLSFAEDGPQDYIGFRPTVFTGLSELQLDADTA